MQIVRNYHDWPGHLRGCALAIGNFDGLHRGHVALLSQLIDAAQAQNIPAAVMCFEPHPRHYFQKDAPELRLQSFAQKAAMLRHMGVDAILAQRFNSSFAGHSASRFMQTVLCDHLAARLVMTGEDFIFGHQRSGNAGVLVQFSQTHQGFIYHAITPLGNVGEGKYSSSKIREHLRQGEMPLAAGMLGRPYSMMRPVLHGDKRGRELGFPTANMLPPPLLLPRLGVYAISAEWTGGNAYGIANLGRRPTVGGTRIQLEAHLFDVEPDLYGVHLNVEFHHHLRDEMPFEHLEALKEQLQKDCVTARTALGLAV